MDYGSSLEAGKRQQRFVLVFRKYNMPRQTKHVEELDGLTVYFREGDFRATLLRNVNDSEEDRDTDTVHQLSIAEVDDQRTATAIQLPAALTFDFFTGKPVQIIAGINNSRGTNAVRPYQ